MGTDDGFMWIGGWADRRQYTFTLIFPYKRCGQGASKCGGVDDSITELGRPDKEAL